MHALYFMFTMYILNFVGILGPLLDEFQKEENFQHACTLYFYNKNDPSMHGYVFQGQLQLIEI